MKIELSTSTDYLETNMAAEERLAAEGLYPTNQWGQIKYGKTRNEFFAKLREYIRGLSFSKNGLSYLGRPLFVSDDGQWEYFTNGQDRMWCTSKSYCSFIGSADEIVDLWHRLMPAS